ncbi:lipoprotein [Agromyces rhizosphaerae]|uniref:Lipoprotein n=1 Tax=Agromyces rhizosphaerae TaxID=88374 RepID=A0A9W6CY98_9MICO|nr:DUF58 domain-containing protein [Agromyces rhizosphaerae]GLI26063.1 lipoprotein [Agromyces rhizosphaerae]
MAWSGRFALLVATGVVPLVLLGGTPAAAWAVLAGWLGLAVTAGLVDLALAGSPRQVALERETPARVRLGEHATGRLLVTNRGARRIRGVVRDGWEPSAGLAGANRARVVLPPGERRAVPLAFVPTRRGERRARSVTLRSWGPLGLWARQATLSAEGRIRVLPPFRSRRHLASRVARLRELEGNTPVMVRGAGTEFDSLREYVRGDDVRSIDWRATARRDAAMTGGGQRLMVRTWRPERDRRVVLVVDTGRTAAARVGDEPRLDTSIEASLLLAALASRAGDRVDLVAWDRRVRARVQSVTGPTLLSRMVDALAPVEAGLIDTDWSAVPALVRQVTSQRALVVLCTGIDTPAAARGMLGVLPTLTASHTVLVASVTDPSLDADRRDRTDREAAYLAGAAERALRDADRVAAAIRRLGADVVQAAPAELPPALADRYLALKAAGRL